MNLNFFGGKINENYAWELTLFYKYREFKDGIDFVEFDTKYDRYMEDHNPKFELSLRILNCTIFDFGIYNVWHADNSNSPYFEQWKKETYID